MTVQALEPNLALLNIVLLWTQDSKLVDNSNPQLILQDLSIKDTLHHGYGQAFLHLECLGLVCDFRFNVMNPIDAVVAHAPDNLWFGRHILNLQVGLEGLILTVLVHLGLWVEVNV